MDYPFSALAKASLIPSAINQLTAEFAADFREGTDINLGVGYVNDKTIPVEAIREAYDDIMAHPDHYRNALNYGGAEGSPNLRDAILTYYLKYHIGGLTGEDFSQRKILIGANGATSILDALSDMLKPGIVITADPYYYIYTETLERKGFRILAIPEDKEGLNPRALNEALKLVDPQEISFFYIVTVNNPTTVVLSNNRRKAIVELAQTLSKAINRRIPVIFDKAYEDIIHNPETEQPVSGLKFDSLQQVFEVGTLSKILAPALRIGYIICPDNDFTKILIQRTSDIGFSSPLINQEISGWLLRHYIHIQKVKVNKGYRDKARAIKQLFTLYLSDYIESFSGGDAAFYFYITFKAVRTDKGSPFFNFLSRITGDPEIDGEAQRNPRLVYIPGTICSKSEKAKYQLRLSYGFEEPEVFERAVKLMAEACKYALQF
ncbi:aminotransferase class I/II-fold pyridoxal phosphate-dependent enzyme [Saccharicrinis sp. FJH54]|uniref:aminotransferase class I/II-fold pyridoxal phosphate-dependent enzyme n=1 Tax=Saccharicrinis sp. FJH54 TaxID=3344665 RepID=UPI0035D3EAC6